MHRQIFSILILFNCSLANADLAHRFKATAQYHFRNV